MIDHSLQLRHLIDQAYKERGPMKHVASCDCLLYSGIERHEDGAQVYVPVAKWTIDGRCAKFTSLPDVKHD